MNCSNVYHASREISKNAESTKSNRSRRWCDVIINWKRAPLSLWLKNPPIHKRPRPHANQNNKFGKWSHTSKISWGNNARQLLDAIERRYCMSAIMIRDSCSSASRRILARAEITVTYRRRKAESEKTQKEESPCCSLRWMWSDRLRTQAKYGRCFDSNSAGGRRRSCRGLTM